MGCHSSPLLTSLVPTACALQEPEQLGHLEQGDLDWPSDTAGAMKAFVRKAVTESKRSRQQDSESESEPPRASKRRAERTLDTDALHQALVEAVGKQRPQWEQVGLPACLPNPTL